MKAPATIRIVRVMCPGRVDPAFILDAFKDVIDGVIVTECHIGDCHYLKGNKFARDRFERFKEILKIFNLDKRFRLEWVSASEGKRFAEVITEFTNEIKKQGPLQAI